MAQPSALASTLHRAHVARGAAPRRPSRRRSVAAALLLATLPIALSCDNITEGQPALDPKPPVLKRILIQDESSSGGRNAATDLLEESPPVKCSLIEPCPLGDVYSHPPCNLATGVCPNPLSRNETPPAIGTPVNFGGNQIRFVFSKPLDPALFATTISMLTGLISGSVIKDPTVIGIFGPDGKELPGEKYWDPLGVPADTSNLFTSPFGPALVIKPKVSLIPLSQYVIRIDASKLRDAAMQPVTSDGNGAPVKTDYAFTTEGLGPAGGAVKSLTDAKRNPFGSIDALDAYVIRVSARFDPATLKVVIKRDGAVVETVATPANINSPALCPAQVGDGPTAIHVFRVNGETLVPWIEDATEVGMFTASIEAVAIDNRAATFSSDPFGKTPYVDVPFTVRHDVDRDKQFLAKDRNLPWQCVGARPMDMSVGYAPDLAVPPDAAAPDGG